MNVVSQRHSNKTSHSWNPGELPSIYVENNEGNTFRIANHFNNKNSKIILTCSVTV